MRIVVGEPDYLLGRYFHFVFGEVGHDAVIATDSSETLHQTLNYQTGAVLLNVSLSDSTGTDVCERLRGCGYDGPILFVTPREELQEKLDAFNAGADDIMLLPVDPREMLVRVEAVSQRYQEISRSPGVQIKVGEIELCLSSHTLYRPGHPPLRLSPTEVRVLECLMRYAGTPVSREMIIQYVWGWDFEGIPNRVDVYLGRLRSKLEPVPSQPIYLHTVRNFGYYFQPPSTNGDHHLAGDIE